MLYDWSDWEARVSHMETKSCNVWGRFLKQTVRKIPFTMVSLVSIPNDLIGEVGYAFGITMNNGGSDNFRDSTTIPHFTDFSITLSSLAGIFVIRTDSRNIIDFEEEKLTNSASMASNIKRKSFQACNALCTKTLGGLKQCVRINCLRTTLNVLEKLNR